MLNSKYSLELSERNFFKANEIEELFLHYFPILLRNRLRKKYYEHFLLIVYAINYLSKPVINTREIDHAEFLIDLFVKDLARLYGPERITYNSHVCTHIYEYVRMYGSISFSNTYSYEDVNGFVKSVVHGPNEIDAEIVNTMKICNAYQILKHIIDTEMGLIKKNNENHTKLAWSKLNVAEKERIIEYCNANNIDEESVSIYSRIKSNNGVVYTSQKYDNQKKRDNSQACWECQGQIDLKYGIIQLFFKCEEKVLALIRELVPSEDNSSLFNKIIQFPKIHTLVHLSYCLHPVELGNIKKK